MNLKIIFEEENHLIKSLMAVYIAAKTPSRDKTIVKTGVFQPVSLSSFTPPQTVTRIIPIIWNANPEYLAKSCIPLFRSFFGFFFFNDSCSGIDFGITHFAISGK
jgi:hypothetical protein